MEWGYFSFKFWQQPIPTRFKFLPCFISRYTNLNLLGLGCQKFVTVGQSKFWHLPSPVISSQRLEVFVNLYVFTKWMNIKNELIKRNSLLLSRGGLQKDRLEEKVTLSVDRSISCSGQNRCYKKDISYAHM